MRSRGAAGAVALVLALSSLTVAVPAPTAEAASVVRESVVPIPPLHDGLNATFASLVALSRDARFVALDPIPVRGLGTTASPARWRSFRGWRS